MYTSLKIDQLMRCCKTGFLTDFLYLKVHLLQWIFIQQLKQSLKETTLIRHPLSVEQDKYTDTMSWGSSWSSSSFSGGSGGGGGWGSSSWGSGSGNKDPAGTHNASCIAGTGSWGNSGLMKSYYDESCSGCRHDRAKSSWSSPPSGGNPALKVAALFGIGYMAKKSLWD